MRRLRIIHRWIGITVSVIVLLVSASGGLLLLRGPYYRARFPALAQPITAEEVAAQGRVLADIEERFGAQISRITFPRAGTNAFHLRLSDGSLALVDPRSAAVLARETWRDSLPVLLFELHAHLLLGQRGTVINGVLGLVLLFLGSTGLVLWWPRRAVFRLRRVVPRRASAGELLRSHAASGIVALVPALLLASTGAALTFYTPVSAALSAVLDEAPPERPDRTVVPRSAPRQPWSLILACARAALPDGELVMLYPGAAANAVLTFRARLPGEWHPNGRSYVLMDPYEARVVQTIDARRQGLGTRLAFSVYPLHAAKVGGFGYALFVALGAIGLVWLAVGGVAAYLQQGRRPVHRPGRRSVARRQGVC